MIKYFTIENNFFGENSPKKLLDTYGSPLYVYNEQILRRRCQDMLSLVSYPKFIPSFSTKANSNVKLLQIIKEEGLYADAMSPGEIYVLESAGFRPEEIFFIPNNVSKEEMSYAIDRGILMSADSLSQLETFGQINSGGSVALRLNPGIGIGHHKKVITAGLDTKFGINLEDVEMAKDIISKYNLNLVGLNQHIGSLFLDSTPFIESVKNLLDIARGFKNLQFIDFGGGFGIPYRKQSGENPLDLKQLGTRLTSIITSWARDYGQDILFKIEPGRYIVAESGILLGTVHSIKENGGITYIGTDIGFNTIMRPVLYDAHHDIEVYRDGNLLPSGKNDKKVTIVGNICESGDIISKDIELPNIKLGDIIGIIDAGAYGYSMASNYNNRLRPAEVLIENGGQTSLIRRRDTLDDLLRNFTLT